jgi:hypothetical protein
MGTTGARAITSPPSSYVVTRASDEERIDLASPSPSTARASVMAPAIVATMSNADFPSPLAVLCATHEVRWRK